MESWHSGLDVWLTDLPSQTWGRAEKSQNLWKMALATLFFWPKNWNISGVYYQNSTYGGSGDRIHSGEQEILLVFYNICTGWASKGQKPLNSQTRFRKMALPRANQICPEQNQVRVIKGSVPEDFCKKNFFAAPFEKSLGAILRFYGIGRCAAWWPYFEPSGVSKFSLSWVLSVVKSSTFYLLPFGNYSCF